MQYRSHATENQPENQGLYIQCNLLTGCPFCIEKVACHDRWSLIGGYIYYELTQTVL